MYLYILWEYHTCSSIYLFIVLHTYISSSMQNKLYANIMKTSIYRDFVISVYFHFTEIYFPSVHVATIYVETTHFN